MGDWNKQLLMAVSQRDCLVGLPPVKALTTCTVKDETEEQQAEVLIVREKTLEMFDFIVTAGLDMEVRFWKGKLGS